MTVALVTGSSTGIGAATALALARAGHHTLATMRNPDAGEPLLEAATAEDLQLEVVALDVTDPTSCEAAVAAAEAHGGVDVLVNNAGIGAGSRMLEDTRDEDWRRAFETNVFGAARMTRLVLPGMRRKRQGAVVNISSIAGRLATSPQTIYVSSKWALEAMSEVLAQEVSSLGIKVVLIEPGIILTPIFQKGDPSYEAGEDYAHLQRRIRSFFAAAVPDASPASVIGEAVVEALARDGGFQRIVVGHGGAEFVAARESMTDEEWAAFGADLSDREINDFFRPILGREIFPEA